jgi:predicted ATPase
MLDRVTITNFKGIHELTASFGRFTLLVGPNGVGKTSVIEAIDWVRVASGDGKQGNSVPYVTDPDSARERVRHSQLSFRIEASVNQQCCALEVTKEAGPNRFLGGEDLAEDWSVYGLRDKLAAWCQQWHTFRLTLSVEILRSAALPTLLTPMLGRNGSGLAGYLQYLHGLRNGSLEAIEASLQAVVPRFRRLIFRPVQLHSEVAETIEVNGVRYLHPSRRSDAGIAVNMVFADGSEIPAQHVSEGTLLALATLAAAMPPSGGPNTVLLIDDLDRALHPTAQMQLVKMLRKTLDAVPGLQIIATTHSPDLVDVCTPEEVLVMGFHPERGPLARPLSSHPQAAEYRTLLRTGEFWGSVGEDWVSSEAAS